MRCLPGGQCLPARRVATRPLRAVGHAQYMCLGHSQKHAAWLNGALRHQAAAERRGPGGHQAAGLHHIGCQRLKKLAKICRWECR